MPFQGNLQHEYTGTNCIPLEGPGVRQELIGLLRYLRLCLFFTKKPYEVFLEFGGYGQSDILITKTESKVCITLSRFMCSSIDCKWTYLKRTLILFSLWSRHSQLSVMKVPNASSFSFGARPALRIGWQQRLLQRFHSSIQCYMKDVNPSWWLDMRIVEWLQRLVGSQIRPSRASTKQWSNSQSTELR